MKKNILFITLAILLTSCQVISPLQPTATPTFTPTTTNTPQPTSTNTPNPTITPTQTPALNCSADNVIEKLKNEIPYDEYTLSYNTFKGVRYLFFWIVDPSLSPTAKETELETNFGLAIKHSIELAYKLKQADICTVNLFDAINPVVVDQNHNGWFSGIIDIKDLPSSAELTEKDVETIKDSIITKGAWQRQTTTDIQKTPSNSCTWNEVVEKVSRHFSQKPLNSYMLVADNNGITFTVQYQAESKDDGILVVMNTARELACLQPPVDIVGIILVDKNGNVISSERIPIESIPLP